MKIKILRYLAVVLIVVICCGSANATTNADFVNKYYRIFESAEQVGPSIFFFKDVPPSSRAEVLADILDRAVAANPQNLMVIRNVIEILRGFQGPVTWNAHLEKSVLDQAKSPDLTIRELLIEMLAIARKDQNRDLILSFQNDPDQEIRYAALHDIVRWPDAESIYQKFIQDHQSDPNYAKSVQAARNHINIVHELQKADGN